MMGDVIELLNHSGLRSLACRLYGGGHWFVVVLVLFSSHILSKLFSCPDLSLLAPFSVSLYILSLRLQILIPSISHAAFLSVAARRKTSAYSLSRDWLTTLLWQHAWCLATIYCQEGRQAGDVCV